MPHNSGFRSFQLRLSEQMSWPEIPGSMGLEWDLIMGIKVCGGRQCCVASHRELGALRTSLGPPGWSDPMPTVLRLGAQMVLTSGLL